MSRVRLSLSKKSCVCDPSRRWDSQIKSDARAICCTFPFLGGKCVPVSYVLTRHCFFMLRYKGGNSLLSLTQMFTLFQASLIKKSWSLARSLLFVWSATCGWSLWKLKNNLWFIFRVKGGREILLCTPSSVICMIFLSPNRRPLDAPGFAVTALIPGVVRPLQLLLLPCFVYPSCDAGRVESWSNTDSYMFKKEKKKNILKGRKEGEIINDQPTRCTDVM